MAVPVGRDTAREKVVNRLAERSVMSHSTFTALLAHYSLRRFPCSFARGEEPLVNVSIEGSTPLSDHHVIPN